MKGKKYLLFDLDGTLTDSKPGIISSIKYGLTECGITPPDDATLETFIGPPIWDSLVRVYKHSREQADKVVAKYREHYTTKGMFDNSVYEGIEDLLAQALKKEKTLIVATSKPLVFAETILEYLGIKRYFKYVYGGDLEGKLSSKEDVVKCVLQGARIDNLSEAVMIGDTKYDMYGASFNGIGSVGVTYGYGKREELIEYGAGVIVDSVLELAGVLL
ncbi:MAG: HAD hydrolase-like protein [Clostridiales bacterium]|jgi:phosphoglycolate phosphatase|nr:HAD hydrolase-like protein [Clostridiales bacterium]